VRVNICKKNWDFLPNRAARVAQDAQKITDLTWANKQLRSDDAQYNLVNSDRCY